ncbi:IucA/IucC family protein [Actinopolyspora mortivallis]|uniref:IucA/IucC family protein n=1 Tax=Actinopolyspora mortivallis TaxID=33906 RepID=UPI0021590A43|nr:IucA/IucC family protein [Actinopolyspora mortivallis]
MDNGDVESSARVPSVPQPPLGPGRAGRGRGTDPRPWARWVVLSTLLAALVREGMLDPSEARRRGVRFGTRPVTATGREELTAPVLLSAPRGGSEEHVRDPVRILDVLWSTGLVRLDLTRWRALRSDLADSASGLARSVRAGLRRADRVSRAARPWRFPPFSALLDALRRTECAGFPLSTVLEQWALDGHPWQPVARTRTGLSPEQARHYAPEFGAEVGLRLVAVAAHTVSGVDSVGGQSPREAGWRELRRVFPQAVRKAVEELEGAGHVPADYVLIPVHPYQLRHVLPRLHGDAIRDGTLRVLGATVAARPLMSLRTLDAREPGGKAGMHVKTAVEVRLTGAVRGVSEEAVHNGPRLSALLGELVSEDPELAVPDEGGRPGFEVCRELLGIRHVPRSTPESGWPDGSGRARQRSLGAILRAEPEQEADEVALPVAALLSRSPLTGNRLVHDVLTEVRAGRTRQRAACRWLDRYLRVGVVPPLVLLVRYGIAVEPHPQNTVLVLRGGMPRRCLVRDLGGARVLHERLARSGRELRLLEGSALHCPDPVALRRKLFFPLFVNQLGELVAALARAADCPQRVLWRVVSERAAGGFARLAATARCPDEAAEVAVEKNALFHEPWPLKTMLAMRLSGLVTEQRYVPGPNPLVDP